MMVSYERVSIIRMNCQFSFHILSKWTLQYYLYMSNAPPRWSICALNSYTEASLYFLLFHLPILPISLSHEQLLLYEAVLSKKHIFSGFIVPLSASLCFCPLSSFSGVCNIRALLLFEFSLALLCDEDASGFSVRKHQLHVLYKCGLVKVWAVLVLSMVVFH